QRGAIAYPDKAHFTIGAHRVGETVESMAGQVEQISLFDKALTAAEVTARFRERKGHFPDMEVVRPNVTDWPTYLRDSRRTGIAEESLKFPLYLQWVYKARH